MKRILIVGFLIVIAAFCSFDSSMQNPNSITSKQAGESGIWLDYVDTYVGSNEFYDETLSISICFNYTLYGTERMVERELFLSPDNVTFLLAYQYYYNPQERPANGTAGFSLNPPSNMQLPFDVYEGQTMYGYAEISTTEDETYRTRTFSIEILLTIIRPYFGIPSGLFLLYAILASIPVIGFCYYLIIRDPKR